MDKHLNMAHGHDQAPVSDDAGLDPVCGMTVDKASASARELVAEHEGITYYFCGRGCKLEFGDDPGRFLDPSYIPAM
ncbi:MAG: YHS domain-containing protein [Chloroflexota bacterium]